MTLSVHLISPSYIGIALVYHITSWNADADQLTEYMMLFLRDTGECHA